MTVNKLQKLESQLNSLPIQTLLNSNASLFNNVINSIESQGIEIDTAVQKLSALRVIKKIPNLLKNERQLFRSSVSKISSEITLLINAQQPISDQVSSKVSALKRTVQSLTFKINEDWNNLCNSHNEQVAEIKPLIERLDVKAFIQLRKVESALSPGLDALPITEEGMQVVIDAIEWTRTIVSTYGIADSVQVFLQASRIGEGDPKCLLEPEVQKYLESHPSMWNSLKVVWR